MDNYKKTAKVWTIPAIFFLFYGLLFLFTEEQQTLEKTIDFILNLSPVYLSIAGFICILLGATYAIGPLFPFATIVIILPVVAEQISFTAFIMVIGSIFFGWILSSLCNIIIAQRLLNRLLSDGNIKQDNTDVKSSLLVSWVPTFRANDEVAQIVCSAKPLDVFISSTKVKLFASTAMMSVTFILAKLIDLSAVTTQMGYIGSFVFFGISMIVIGINLRKSHLLK